MDEMKINEIGLRNLFIREKIFMAKKHLTLAKYYAMLCATFE